MPVQLMVKMPSNRVNTFWLPLKMRTFCFTKNAQLRILSLSDWLLTSGKHVCSIGFLGVLLFGMNEKDENNIFRGLV